MNPVFLNEIIRKFGILSTKGPIEFIPFKSAEDGKDYEVWLFEVQNQKYVLKKAKGDELEVYSSFFMEKVRGVPEFFGSVSHSGSDYILLEYVKGDDASQCNRLAIKKSLDALIFLQDKYWEDNRWQSTGLSFEKGFDIRLERGKYLNDPEIEMAYNEYVRLYSKLPKTLCHDDLLPFNILVDEEATIIDWEVAGMLPYPSSFARLIAHSSEEKDAFFFMSDDDKAFAIEYYYTELVSKKGIAYQDYIFTLKLFLLYEYCEWVMLGNKYKDADMERYTLYFKKAKDLAKTIAKDSSFAKEEQKMQIT